MNGLQTIKEFCRMHYDKMLAFAALLGLLISLVYLALQIGSIQRLQAEEARRIDAMAPAHPKVEALDTVAYEAALNSIRQPAQLNVEAWTNRYLFFPEDRVWCVICLRPIGYAVLQCPFCGETQPPLVDVDRDTDGDGIPDRWETLFGLDPHDPTDAGRDNDGSGFTSLEQFMLDPETGAPVYDLRDPQSHPPYAFKLKVDEIQTRPFPLRFMSRSTMGDGSQRFALNLAGRTYFTRLGDTNVVGFAVVAFEERFVERVRQGSPRPVKVDESVLTLKRGDKLIPLMLNRPQQHDEFTVRFHFEIDDERFAVKPGELFNLRHEKYRLKNVDMRRQSAVVNSLKDDGLWSVRPRPHTAVRIDKQVLDDKDDLDDIPPPAPPVPERTPRAINGSEKPSDLLPFGDVDF